MFCELPEFGRCCFCLPLRRGILTFGYINTVFSAFMIGIYSFSIRYDYGVSMVYHGSTSDMPEEMCIVMYCLEIIFNVMLLYGAHMKIIKYIKISYYFMVTTVVASVSLQLLQMIMMGRLSWMIEIIVFGLAGLFLQLYLMFLVRSLIKKLETSGPHVYENQLHQIVNGEVKMESNGIYNSSTVPIDHV